MNSMIFLPFFIIYTSTSPDLSVMHEIFPQIQRILSYIHRNNIHLLLI
jgi:hypothetical protein